VKFVEKIVQAWSGLTERKHLLIILLLAFFVRVGFVLVLKPNGFYFSDTRHYDRAATSLLAGEGFGEKYYRAPLYPIVMAGVYSLFGHSFVTMRIFESVLGVVLCWLSYFICRRLMNGPTALLAAFLAALFPHFILLAGILYPTQVFVLLLGGSFLFLLEAEKNRPFLYMTISGILAGLAALTIPAIFFVIPFWLLWICLRSIKQFRRNLVLAAIFVMALIATLAPWTIRNYQKYGRLTLVQPLPHTVLPNLVDSSAQEKEVESGFRGTTNYLKENPTGTKDDAIGKTIAHYILHPWGTLRYLVSEMGHFWALYPDRLDTANPHYRESIHAKDQRMVTTGGRLWPYLKVISIVVMSLVFILAVSGLFSSPISKQHLLLVLLTVTGFSVGYSLIYAEVRYRIPIEPFIIMFTAAGARYWIGHVFNRIRGAHAQAAQIS
jgi:4-amino-4-deoxy-L-arabinose transferase-like glycosyltransferase